MIFYCWHRPGNRWKGHIYLCRHCEVAVEECPCVSFGRTPNPSCEICEGSGWIAILRGRMQVLRDFVFGGYIRNADGWDDAER